MSLTPEQQIKSQFALALGKEKTLEQIKELYDWAMGPKQTIVPVSGFEVVKN